MTRIALILFGLCLSALAHAEPALVTLAQGGVTVDGKPAPEAPFALQDGQSLAVAEGGSVVLLFGGSATRLRGPQAAVSTASLTVPEHVTGPAQGALTELLTRDVRFERAGASRGGDLQLVRPVPGSTVLQPQRIAWRCEDCGPQPVQIYDFLQDRVVWSGTGDGEVVWAGPTLAPGPHLVRVGAREFSVTVASEAEQARIKLAHQAADQAVEGLKAQGEKDMAALASIPAGILLRAGLPSEALSVVDEALAKNPDHAGLLALRATCEQRAGLPKESAL